MFKRQPDQNVIKQLQDEIVRLQKLEELGQSKYWKDLNEIIDREIDTTIANFATADVKDFTDAQFTRFSNSARMKLQVLYNLKKEVNTASEEKAWRVRELQKLES